MNGRLPLDGNGELPGARARLDDNIGLLNTSCEELLLGTGHKRVDDG